MYLTDDELATIFERLDSPCWQCGGRGRASTAIHKDVPPNWIANDNSSDPRACGPCDGRGHIATKAGAALLAFMERHTKAPA